MMNWKAINGLTIFGHPPRLDSIARMHAMPGCVGKDGRAHNFYAG